jgi:hypothetical protein
MKNSGAETEVSLPPVHLSITDQEEEGKHEKEDKEKKRVYEFKKGKT